MTQFGGSRLAGEDLLVFGGRIFPHADRAEWVEAMLIRGGVVVGLGDTADLRALSPSSVPELDLQGRTVLPGLIDAHTHVEATAISRGLWLDVRGLEPTAACDVVARATTPLQDGEWLQAQGTFAQVLPTKDQLDRAAPRNPVLIRQSAHKLQANTEALRRAGMVHRAPRVGPGVVVHVDEEGVPTGLVEEGFHLFPAPDVTEHQLDDMIVTELRTRFARAGVTTVYEIPVSVCGIAAYLRLARAGELPVRITLTPIVAPPAGAGLDRIDEWAAADFGDGVDSDMIAAGGVKIFIDGDNEQMFDSKYFDREPRQWGAVTRTLGQLREELICAIGLGAQVWIHAIGDLAQEMVLEAIDQAQSRAGRPRLPIRLEHAANLQLSPKILESLQRLNVIAVPTASFIAVDDGTGVYAFRTLMDAGMRPPGNSDTAGSIEKAPSPWFGMAMMIDRRNAHGLPIAPDEAVTIDAAIRTYTAFSAEAAGLTGVLGALGEGAAADFAVYPDDPRALSPALMREVEADLTLVGGRVVWSRSDRQTMDVENTA
ncbi:N-substituted formamide deformylase precursor [Microbacterium azadirachtae]|uniref:N-substituted formamide deformylase n=2 Tax=Microbacterium azadirachtae TaxID=582680 RepID=A0A0F0L4W4_9MICO|nr:N-substituted formamide deformylase precursor [Microbacterium azadirachtae]